MKLQADRAALLKALAHVQGVADHRGSIPILGTVLLTVQAGAMTMTATDMELSIVAEVPATATVDGATAVSATVLYDIVRKLPGNASVELHHPGGDANLTLRAGRYATSMVALPTEDFPAMKSGTTPHIFSLTAAQLRGLIDRTRFAISTEETRYYLNGIYLHAAQSEGVKVLRAVATDGHRLARIEEALPDGADGMPGVIVPRHTAAELRKMLDDAAVPVEIALSDTLIRFRVGGILLTSKLIDGTFPEYERVIPRGNDRVLRVGKKDFADTVARVAAISSERSAPVKLSLARDLLVISAASPEHGSASEELDGDRVQYAAADMEVGFQARYLTDITDQIADAVEFCFGTPDAPAIVRPGGGDASALYVLMPMRV